MRCSHCPAEFEVFPAVCPLCGEPVVLAGRYQIKGLIGRGGMGEVYLAYDQRLATEVALKRLPARYATDPDLARALTKEARLLARLTDDCIVRMFDLAETPEGIFLILEYVCGPSLQELLGAGYRLPIVEVLRVFQFVCKGLTTAHASGIIHRDLKPGNFLVALRGEEQKQFRSTRTLPPNLSNARIKLADFGIAKASSPQSSMMTSVQNLVSGTPPFMAPEQFRGELPSPETDVYTLGVIAYLLLSGRLPFTEGDLGYCHCFVQPPPMSNCPAPMNQMVLRAMAKQRQERFPSASAFYEALVAAAGQQQERPPEPKPRVAEKEPVRPPIVPERPERRLPLEAVLVAVILLVLGAAAAAVHWFGRQPVTTDAVAHDESPVEMELRGPPNVQELPPIVEEARGVLSLKGVNGPRKGRVAWKFTIPFTAGGVEAIGVDGTVYLKGINAIGAVREGHLVWAFSGASLDQISPDGRVWASVIGGDRYYCLNRDGQGGLLPDTGESRYGTRIRNTFEPPKRPPIDPGCGSRELIANGRPEIELDNDCSGRAETAADGNTVVGTKMPSLYCVGPSGSLIWKVALPCMPQSVAAGQGGRAAACRDRSLLLAEDGALRWKITVDGKMEDAYRGMLIDSLGTTYYTDLPGDRGPTHLHAINAAGQSIWKLDFPDVSPGSLHMDGKGRLLFRAGGGMLARLYCISD